MLALDGAQDYSMIQGERNVLYVLRCACCAVPRWDPLSLVLSFRAHACYVSRLALAGRDFFAVE